MRSLRRHLFDRRAIVLALTLSASACLPFALSPAVPDAALTLVLPTTLVGIASSFLIWKPGSRRAPVLAIWMLLGPAALFIRVGGLAAMLFDAMRGTLALAAVLLQPDQALGQLHQLSAWLIAQGQFWDQASLFANRAVTWLAASFPGLPGSDLAARALWLSIGMWLLAGWTGWRIRLKDDPLGGLLPFSVLIAIALNNSIQDRWPLWLHLVALLLLLAVMHLSRLTGSWESRRIDFSDSIPEDTTVNSIVLVIVLLVVAYSASVFSIKDLVDRFRERRSVAAGSVASARGMGSDSGRVRSGAPNALEASHVISAGPRLSHDLVMSISTGELPPMQHAQAVDAPRYYWRGATYQEYTGRGWTNATMAMDEVPAGTDLLLATQGEGAREVHGVVSIPAATNTIIYWTGALDETDLPLEVIWRSEPQAVATIAPLPVALGNGDMIGAQLGGEPLATGESYHFTSVISQASEQQLRAAPVTYPAWVTERYLQLPQSLPERVRALARDITVRARTPYDRALAIETYLRRIPYSLDVPAPPPDHDAADFFLFDLKKGYCDYYATSMAVLARASGLPARLVTGFDSGSYDPYTAQYVVTQSDAHAWVEIYFTATGWVEFEPTGNQPAPKRESGPRAISTPLAPAPEGKTGNPLGGFDARSLRWLGWSVPGIVVLLLAGLGVDTLRLSQMEPADVTRRVYRRMRRWTRPLRTGAGLDETANEYARALARRLHSLGGWNWLPETLWRPAEGAVNELTRIYTESLFGPTPLSRSQGRRAIRLWASLRWRMLLLGVVAAITRRLPARRGAPSSPLDSRGE